MINKLIAKILGTKNEKELKRYRKRVALINELEPKYEAMSDDELKSAFEKLKHRVLGDESLDNVRMIHLLSPERLQKESLVCDILMCR